MQIEEKLLTYFKSWDNGFSVTLSGISKQYNPLRNLPPKSTFQPAAGEALNNFEVSLRLRYAFLEKFLETNFYRTSLGSPYPITEIRYSKGMSGILNSNYDYSKLYVSVSDFSKMLLTAVFITMYLPGKTFGTLPYMLLEVHLAMKSITITATRSTS
jgi:hypothetical protein